MKIPPTPKYRQVERLANNFPGAREQLDDAIIIHWRYALSTFVYHLKALLQFKCAACGNRHLRTLRRTKPYSLTCFYGFNPKHIYLATICAIKHGED